MLLSDWLIPIRRWIVPLFFAFDLAVVAAHGNKKLKLQKRVNKHSRSVCLFNKYCYDNFTLSMLKTNGSNYTQLINAYGMFI